MVQMTQLILKFRLCVILLFLFLLGGEDCSAVFKIFDQVETKNGTKIVVIDIENVWMINVQDHNNYIITGSYNNNVDASKFIRFYSYAVENGKKIVLGREASKIILLENNIEYIKCKTESEGMRSIKINPATYFAKFALSNEHVVINDYNGWIFLDAMYEVNQKNQRNEKNENIAHTNQNIKRLSEYGYKIVGIDSKNGNIFIIEKGENVLFFDSSLYCLFDEKNACLKEVLFNFFDGIEGYK